MDRTLPPLDTGNPAEKKNFFSYIKASLSRINREYGYLAVAFTIPVILMYLMYLCRGIYPFGDSTILVLDLNGQYVYFYEGLWDILHGDASCLYSFSRALGGEFMGTFDYYVASPFSLLIGLFPREWIQETLLVVFLLKGGLCGFNMGFYLHKHSETKSKLTIITFSILYALTSYCIIQQNNSMWIDAVLWLPILAYAIEELIKRGHFRLFVFTLAITLISNFYIGYMVCIFLVAYCFYYYFAHNQNGENNPTGEKNHFVRSVIRVACWSVLAIGIAAFAILSARYSLSFGKNEFSDPNWEITQKFSLFEMLIKFLPASYDTVRPAGLPFLYCGVLTLILAPVFFLSKKVSNREKVAAALLIFFFIASFATSSIDLIWHGFQKPNWLNYRYSFMLCFFLIVLAFRGFEHLAFTSRKALLAVVAFIGFVILVLQQMGDFITASNEKLVVRPFASVWLGLGCLIVYFIILCLWGQAKPAGKQKLAIVLVFVVAMEVFTSGLVDMNSFDKDVTFSKHSRYTDLTDTFRPITTLINEKDDGFFRMEKTYHRKTNDNFALDINGLSNSTSTLNRSTIDFLRGMGYSAKSHWAKYLGGTPVNDSLLGIKYIISDTDLSHYYGEPIYTREDYNYDKKANVTKDYDVYFNPYALSLLYGVSSDMKDFNPDLYNNPIDRLNAMISTMLGEEETLQIFVPAVQNGDPTLVNATASVIAAHKKYAVDDVESAGVLTYSYTLPENVEAYYFFPSDYLREVKLKANGSSKGSFGGNETHRLVSLGKTTTGELELEVRIENDSHNLYIKEDWASCVYYIDTEVFADAMERLAETQVILDNESVDDHLFGTLTTTEKNQMIFTSIPYDEGWNITVDGAPVEIFETAGALIAFNVENTGTHDIDLEYMPDTYVTGMTISYICIAIFVLLLLLYPILRKLPVIKHAMGIQRPDLPLLPVEEATILPEDIGHRDEDIPPTQNGVPYPSRQELKEIKKSRQATNPSAPQEKKSNKNKK